MKTKAKALTRTAKAIVESEVQGVDNLILVLRGSRVMLDHDLARIYGVTTKRLNEQVRRNLHRFPEDFMFRLTLDEAREVLSSRSQIATLKKGQNIKHPPHVFTEHGAIMLASVLNSPVAVHASVYVVRAFVRMRSVVMEYAKLARRIDTMERKYDGGFTEVFEAIRRLMRPSSGSARPIGFFHPKKSKPVNHD